MGTERPSRRDTARRRAERVWSQREAELGREATRTSGRRVLGAVAAGILLSLGALLIHSRPFLYRGAVIHGLQQASQAEVQADMEVPARAYTWQLRPWTIARRLRRDPLIASARVGYLGIGHLSVTVRERVPVVGIVQGTTLWEVDATGMLLRGLPFTAGHGPMTVPGLNLPIAVLMGANLGNVTAGQHITSGNVLAAMRVAESLGGAVKTTAGTVVLTGDQVGLITLGGISVNYGNGADAPRKTEILLGILQAIGAQSAQVTAIDLSSLTTPSLTLRPGSPPLNVNGVVTSG